MPNKPDFYFSRTHNEYHERTNQPTNEQTRLITIAANGANNRMCVVCETVVVFCHSKDKIVGKFLLHAHDRNMTNGDFAFFTYFPVRTWRTTRPWNIYNVDPLHLYQPHDETVEYVQAERRSARSTPTSQSVSCC